MSDWTMYIPWRKLQPLALILATLAAVFILLQILGFEIVAKENNSATQYFRPGSEHLQQGVGNTRRQTGLNGCPLQNGGKNDSLVHKWCEKIQIFNTRVPNVISTFDLPDVTDYNVDQSGRYVFPDTFFEPEERTKGFNGTDVILVPFSHVDPGYGQTMEDYYKIFVRGILDLMVKKLDEYRDFTFQWTETVFLERWFRDIDEEKRQKFRDILARGQLEIVLGGWVMPEEGLTNYRAVINQLMEGHQWLKEVLDVQPTNAWVNDAFGYSGTFSYLLKRSGIDNVVLSRIHQALKNTLQVDKNLEFYWRPYWNTSDDNGLFCNVMPFEGYASVCGHEQNVCNQFNYMDPFVRGSHTVFINDNNIHKMATQLHRAYSTTARVYRLRTLLVFIGEDNGFNVERPWNDTYTNYLKLIKHINAIPEFNMKIRFGTLLDYFLTLRNKQRMSTKDGLVEAPPNLFPTVNGDFFPYSDKDNEYWTGYLSNRPWLRRFSRIAESLLRAVDIFSVIANHRVPLTDSSLKNTLGNLRSARRNISLFQHHDAIAGTCFPHVIKDFEKRLLSAYRNSLSVLKVAVITLLQGKPTNHNSLKETIEIKHARVQPTNTVLNTNKESVDLILVNPLFRARTEVVSVSVTNPRIQVKDSDENELWFQVIQDQKMKFIYTLSFAVSIAPFAIKRITIETLPDTDDTQHPFKTYSEIINDMIVTIENDYLTVSINTTTGSLMEICQKGYHQKCTEITSEFLAYSSRKSGPYVFKPEDNAKPIPYLWRLPDVKVQRDSIVTEVVCEFQADFFQTFKLYNIKGPKGKVLHISNTILIPPKKVMNNTEIIWRLDTNIDNKDMFFTDQNGYQFIGRKNRRDMPIESNYYPMTNMAILEDATKRLTLHSAQSLGVASLDDGSVEVMLDRVMDKDDGKGLGMGIGDRVLTMTEFIIQIEHKPRNVPIEEPRFTYPTVNSFIWNELFQDKVIVFSLDSKSPITEFNTAKSEIPCDLSIAGFKMLTNGNNKPVGISLITHRPSFHCHYPAVKDIQCSAKGREVNMWQFLEMIGLENSQRKVSTVEETTLTHTKTLRMVDMCESVQPEKNELKAMVISTN